ncbi:MAG: M18 family aminopeptidase, partial [Ruminococcus sp.]|nr:M18 family aminopeptidase [Ruminococcus sp.]
ASMITADIGLPQLSMHSSFETAGKDDTEYMYKLLCEFFSSSLTLIDENTYKI